VPVNTDDLKLRLEQLENQVLKLSNELHTAKSELYNQLAEQGKYIHRQQEQLNKLKRKGS